MDAVEKITLFCFFLQGVCCRHFFITLPERIQALSGSCVIIKCRFEVNELLNKDLTETAVGVWFKDDVNNNQVFKSDTMQTSFMKGKITGTLKDKDCTTIFYDIRSDHTGHYFFRIEGEGKLLWTYKESSVSIDVIESPVKPQVQLYEGQKELHDQLEVLEGRSVSLRCSAEALCSSLPPTLTWSSTPRILLSETNRLEELIISDLNFTAVLRHHRIPFTCSISYQLQYNTKTAHRSITLHVQYSPKNTSVSVFPSDPVLEGGSVTLTCRSEANPEVLNYSWSKEREGRLVTLQTGDTLIINRAELSDRGVYICTAQNIHGIQKKSVLLDIQYAPQNSNSSSCTGSEAPVCFCEFDGSPSPKVQWLLSGHPVSNSSNTFISVERLSSTGLRSSISLHQSPTHTFTLQCVGRNTHGSAKQQFNVVFVAQNKWFNVYSVLVGVVVGTLLMAILWATTMLFKRNNRTQSGDKTVLLHTDRGDSLNNGGVSLYADKVLMPSAETTTQNHPEQLHYSTINFLYTKAESNDIRGLSSLTTEYAVIQHSGRNVTDKETKTSEVSSVPNEDPIYQVPHKALTVNRL